MSIFEIEKIIIKNIKSNYEICYECFDKMHGHDIAKDYTFANLSTLEDIALKTKNRALLNICSDFTWNKHKLNDKKYYLDLMNKMVRALN